MISASKNGLTPFQLALSGITLRLYFSTPISVFSFKSIAIVKVVTKVEDVQTRDQISLQRQLDGATEITEEIRSGSLDPKDYDAKPFMRENFSHRARDKDLCSSTDEEEQVTNNKVKEAHRKRSGHSKS